AAGIEGDGRIQRAGGLPLALPLFLHLLALALGPLLRALALPLAQLLLSLTLALACFLLALACLLGAIRREGGLRSGHGGRRQREHGGQKDNMAGHGSESSRCARAASPPSAAARLSSRANY